MQFLIDKSLDDYLAFSDERTRSFQNSPSQLFELIRDVDTLIREVWTGTLDTQTVPAFLNMNAYFSFLAAVRMAISGHVSSVFPLARAALESACYAFLLTKDETLQSVWMNPDKGDAESDFTCMYGEDSHEVKHALLACAEYGIVIAYLNAQGIKKQPQGRGAQSAFQRSQRIQECDG